MNTEFTEDTNKDKDFKCKHCNSIIELSYDEINSNKFECPDCKEINILKYPNHSNNENKYKLYTSKHIWYSCFLGTLISSGFLMYLNALRLGQKKKGLYIFLGSILFTIITILLSVFLENSLNSTFPSYIYYLAYFVIARYFLFRLYQEKDVKQYISEGGKEESTAKVIGISLVISLIIIVFVLAITIGYGFISELPDSLKEKNNSSFTLDSLNLKIDENIRLAASYEDKAVYNINKLDSIETKGEGLILLKDGIISNYIQCIKVLKEIRSYKLNEEQIIFVNKLITYYETSLKVYELAYKTIDEETDKYDKETSKYLKILDSLKKEIDN